jgi:DNA-directed RNA polymerase subunit RPC12/RpoP
MRGYLVLAYDGWNCNQCGRKIFSAQRPHRRDVVEEPEGEVITGWQTQTSVSATEYIPAFGGNTMGLIDAVGFHQ